MAERVFMVHPDLPGRRISCAASGVGARQISGWVLDEEQGEQAAAEQPTPAYVHRLLDAFLTGEPLDFGGEPVPADVRARLDEAAADGTLPGVEFGGNDEEAAPAADTEEQKE